MSKNSSKKSELTIAKKSDSTIAKKSDLGPLTLVELRNLCSAKNIKYRSNQSRDELCDLLTSNNVDWLEVEALNRNMLLAKSSFKKKPQNEYDEYEYDENECDEPHEDSSFRVEPTLKIFTELNSIARKYSTSSKMAPEDVPRARSFVRFLEGEMRGNDPLVKSALSLKRADVLVENVKLLLGDKPNDEPEKAATDSGFNIIFERRLVTYEKKFKKHGPLTSDEFDTLLDMTKQVSDPDLLTRAHALLGLKSSFGIKEPELVRGNYRTGSYDFSIVPKTAMTHQNHFENPVTITLDEFCEELEDNNFVNAFTSSSINLMRAKIEFYRRKLEETKREFKLVDDKVRKLRILGYSDSTIKELLPMHVHLEMFIFQLDDLISIIKRRIKETNAALIKRGLLEAINDTRVGIKAIVGREDLKNQIVSHLYAFSKSYLTFLGSFNNIAIYGQAGVGKTFLATVIAHAFAKAGILATSDVKIVTRADLVGQYIGHTAPRTRSLLMQTLEGVLFIDEAYQLAESVKARLEGSRDFGSEAITEIVNFLDKYVGMSIVIVAGYEDLMVRTFMASNEGLPRRFPYRYILTPYNEAELTDILISNINKKIELSIDDDTKNFLFSFVTTANTDFPEVFKNQAGDMLNLATSIVKTIMGSYKIQWVAGDLEHNTPILLAGINDFLISKGWMFATEL